MKIAFDEHIPRAIVRVFQVLAKEGAVPGVDFLSVSDYGIPKGSGDIPWITKFATDGGNVIISGDKGIRSKPHERDALANAGLITFFFSPRWNEKNQFVKSAMLLNWWPRIDKTMKASSIGQCWEIPCQWAWADMKDVSTKGSTPKSTKVVSIKNHGK